jgi:hypothetical protein
MLLQAFFSFFILHKICMHPLFLLPNTTRQRGEGTATVKLGQRGGGVLEWSMLGFGGVSSEFELVGYSYDDECMHDAKC